MKVFLVGFLLSIVLLPHAAASVVISEVFYDANESDNGKEFVELYNPDNQDVDLADWVLEMGNGANGVWSFQATLNGTIPAFGFYLIGGDLVTGTDFQKNLTLQNGPDAVRITDGVNVVDTVGYGNLSYPGLYEGSPAPDVTEGHSLERRPGYLDPLGGNGQDTGNNNADFLDNSNPEPQNSGVTEGSAAVDVTRILNPQGPYLPNTTINVTISYTFLEEQVGLIIRENNLFGIIDPSPTPDVMNTSSGLAKWLFMNNVSLSNGMIHYSFQAPSASGNYSISGEWESVDINVLLFSGIIPTTTFGVLGDVLQGIVEDVFGNFLENAMVELENESVTTDENGSYFITLPDTGEHFLNASKEDFITESELINISSLPDLVFNFTGDTSLVPVQISDPEMLTGVSRWANNFFGDNKLLEVVYQWANTPA